MEWETNDRRANVDSSAVGSVPWAIPVTGWGWGRRSWAHHVQRSQAGALWYYDTDGRCWLWNLECRKAAALTYLTNHPVTVSEYLSAYDAERTTWARRKWGE